LKHVIITADDFGLAREVNAAVEQAHQNGILTAASLMVAGPAAKDAITRARRLPRLRVGLHIVLVEGRPLLSRDLLPDLVDTTGHFRRDMAWLGLQIFSRPSVRRQVAAEVDAQFKAFAATGLALDHVNAHKHFHLHPTVAKLVIAIGRKYGMRALRVPREPASVLAFVEPQSARMRAWLTAPWAALLGRSARRAGLRTADCVFGLRWSGAMTAPRLEGILGHLPLGCTEIYLHPATENSFRGSAPAYQYTDELAALLAPATLATARQPNVTFGGYADGL
jgi:hopanoid biosynthesis associated protein HpnK